MTGIKLLPNFFNAVENNMQCEIELGISVRGTSAMPYT
jgi:hypothetical protein